MIDVEYYQHTRKRSTIDLFSILSAGNDLQQEIGSFFRDFWYLLVILLGFIFLLIFFHKKVFKASHYTRFPREFIHFIILSGLVFILARGGVGLRPVSELDASYFTSPENVGLVLNTPFTIVKSYGKKTLEVPKYFSDEELNKIYNPVQESHPQHLYSQKRNVVIILLESFGAEFVGCAGAPVSYTPFLDSIASKSLNFEYGIANGKRSIEAIPSIYSSIPNWMDEAYITSPYSSNKVNSLAQILTQNGYVTAFFHGATNGSMKFDSFTHQMGVEHYFGRNEYPNPAHFDGTWGIMDEYFLPWSVEKMNEFKKPFFSTIFTLSSHHPYFIPKNWKGKLKKGPHPLCETINYTDESLRLMFQKLRKKIWFNNTIFVFLADHTPMPVSKKYASYTETYHIPIIIYDPSGKLPAKNETQYFQQIDLFPTLLDLLDIKTKFYSFGSSYFNHKNTSMSYAEGNYYYYFDKYLLTFQKGKSRNLVNIKDKPLELIDSISYFPQKVKRADREIKAMIQTFNRDISRNKTFAE